MPWDANAAAMTAVLAVNSLFMMSALLRVRLEWFFRLILLSLRGVVDLRYRFAARQHVDQ